jgi:putative spermidine/putrescine transport system substrate-binding protein
LASWEHIDPAIKWAPGNSVGEEVYGVPYLWVPDVLMYNTEVFSTPPTSWSVIFDEQNLPDGKSNKQRVWAPYEASYIADAAMYLNAKYPWADIPYPFELTQEQLFQTMDVLQEQRMILSAYYDKNNMVEDFDSTSFAAAASNPCLVNMLQDAGYPVSSTIPDEGATTLAFTNMLLEDAPHSVCAYKWIEYSLDSNVQGYTAAQFGANPVVPAACQGASQLLSAEDCERNGSDRFSEFFVAQTPQSACSDESQKCTSVDVWIDAFTKLANP